MYSGWDGGMFLTQHLIGLKDANAGVALSWCFNEFITGSQLTCTVLSNYLATLGDISDKIIFLQLDNCGGENKNWNVLRFLSTLVELGRVKAFHVNFLPVGHTHIDIDQVCLTSVWFTILAYFRYCGSG
jgi:hypothetical protein